MGTTQLEGTSLCRLIVIITYGLKTCYGDTKLSERHLEAHQMRVFYEEPLGTMNEDQSFKDHVNGMLTPLKCGVQLHNNEVAIGPKAASSFSRHYRKGRNQ